MRQALAASAGLHVAVAVLAFVGLPSLVRYEPPTDRPIVVELVTVAAKTNPPPPKPAAKPAEKPKQAKPRPAPPPPPPAAAPPPETVLAPVPKPAPVPPPPQPKPKQVASIPPPPKPAPQAKQKAEPKPEPKPAPPKPPAPAKTPPKKQASKQTDFDQVLNSLNKIRERVEQRDDTAQASEPETPSESRRSTAPNQPDQPLTVSELDFIRAQIQRCWIVPIGAKGVDEMLVDIRVEMNQDGTVRDARIVDFMRMQSDTFFRTVAESARRAVLKCSPLQIPPKKFDQWRSMTLRFNPKDMFGS